MSEDERKDAPCCCGGKCCTTKMGKWCFLFIACFVFCVILCATFAYFNCGGFKCCKGCFQAAPNAQEAVVQPFNPERK